MKTYSFAEIFNIIPKILKTQLPPLLLGEAGIGKSSFINSFAETLGTKAFCLSCNQLADRCDLTGQRLLKSAETDDERNNYSMYFFPHEDIMSAIRYANEHPDETPLLFLDEFNRTSPDVMTAVMSLVTARKIGNTDLPENIKLIFAGNDVGHVTEPDEAVITRFVSLKIEPKSEEFLQIHENNINKYIKEVLENTPNLIVSYPLSEAEVDNGENDTLQGLFNENGCQTFAVPRTIYALSEFLEQNTDEELLAMDLIGLLTKIIESYTGTTSFSYAVYNEIMKQTENNVNIEKPEKFDEFVRRINDESYFNVKNDYSEEEITEVFNFALIDKANNISNDILTAMSKEVSRITPEVIESIGKGKIEDSKLDAIAEDSPIKTLVNSLR